MAENQAKFSFSYHPKLLDTLRGCSRQDFAGANRLGIMIGCLALPGRWPLPTFLEWRKNRAACSNNFGEESNALMLRGELKALAASGRPCMPGATDD